MYPLVCAETALAREHLPADLARDWSPRLWSDGQALLQSGGHQGGHRLDQQILNLEENGSGQLNARIWLLTLHYTSKS